jgi:hypothetical protein
LGRAAFLAIAALVALGLSGAARAEVEKHGDLIVGFDGGIAPRALPRKGAAPVAVRVGATFRSASGADPPPQLRTIAIGINRAGRIDDRGLPTCRVRKIQPSTIQVARRTCGGAIVGSGHVRLRIHLRNQPPFNFRGPLLVFNAARVRGERRLLAQFYGLEPPTAFVLTFRVVRTGGTYGTLITTRLPAEARKWAYVTHFDMRLHRLHTYGGRTHSFVSAGCAAPTGFPGALFPFARADFGFDTENHVKTSLVRDCIVR